MIASAVLGIVIMVSNQIPETDSNQNSWGEIKFKAVRHWGSTPLQYADLQPALSVLPLSLGPAKQETFVLRGYSIDGAVRSEGIVTGGGAPRGHWRFIGEGGTWSVDFGDKPFSMKPYVANGPCGGQQSRVQLGWDEGPQFKFYCSDAAGQPNGLAITFDLAGQIRISGEYLAGARTGSWTHYKRDGTPYDH